MVGTAEQTCCRAASARLQSLVTVVVSPSDVRRQAVGHTLFPEGRVGLVFTGIIQHCGRVRSCEPSAAGRRLIIDAGLWAHRPARGESIAVNGCCLTMIDDGRDLAFDVISQTLSCTTLGDLVVGSQVNLEACVTPATLLSGHLVQGHVDAVAPVLEVANTEADRRLRIGIPAAISGFVISKGSIAVDGVSLTVAALDDNSFAVALIPTTLELTSLGSLRAGDRVNLEADMVVKTIVATVRRMHGCP